MNDKLQLALISMKLPERVSIKQVKVQYKKLIHLWHPDKCRGDPADDLRGALARVQPGMPPSLGKPWGI